MRRKFDYPSALEIEQMAKSLQTAKTPAERKKIVREMCLRLSYIPQNLTKKYKKWAPNYSDLLSVGSVALLNAILTFDHNRCSHFKFWIPKWVNTSIAKAAHKEKIWVDFRENTCTLEEQSDELYAETDIENDLIKKEDENLVRNLLHLLPSNYKNILIMQFGFDGKERSVRDIAADLGISTKKVLILQQEARGALTKLYTKHSSINANK